MGIFDRFKKKKEDSGKKIAKQAKSVEAEKEAKFETKLTPEGKLVKVAKKEKREPKVAKPKKEDTGEAWRVLSKPLYTEKVTALGIFNQYAFIVAPETNKIEVRKAIKKVYGFDPIKVNITNVRGKEVRYGRTEGRTKKWKKAIVTLAEGQKIE